jgi:hypothetical protein
MDTTLELHAQPHPDPQVRRLGFDLTDPYVEQCWSSVLGPTGVALLRRMPVLWAEREPARMPTAELGASLGLVGGAGEHSRFGRTLRRLTDFHLGEWIEPGRALAVYTEVAPLTERQLQRLPGWTQATHERLLGAHLDGIAARDSHSARVADITTRLDRLEQPHTTQPTPSQALGR